jgi:hypothetical protein
LDSDKRHIQVLEKQLADSKRDVALLKWLNEWERRKKTWILPMYVNCLTSPYQAITTN